MQANVNEYCLIKQSITLTLIVDWGRWRFRNVRSRIASGTCSARTVSPTYMITRTIVTRGISSLSTIIIIHYVKTNITNLTANV